MYLREYELMLIVKPETDEATIKEIGEKLTVVCGENDGIRLHFDLWGKKRLAYEIQDFTKGLFYLFNFLGEAEAVTAMERVLRFEDQVLRYMTTKVSDRVEVETRKAQADRDEAERAARRAAEEEAARKAAAEREDWEKRAAEARKPPEPAAAAAPAKAEDKAEDKAEAKAEDKPEAKAEDKPEAKAEEPAAEEKPAAEEPAAEETPVAEEPAPSEPAEATSEDNKD